MALQNLEAIPARTQIISGRCLHLDFDRDGKQKSDSPYKDWAKEFSLMEKELKEGLRLLQILKKEINI